VRTNATMATANMRFSALRRGNVQRAAWHAIFGGAGACKAGARRSAHTALPMPAGLLVAWARRGPQGVLLVVCSFVIVWLFSARHRQPPSRRCCAGLAFTPLPLSPSPRAARSAAMLHAWHVARVACRTRGMLHAWHVARVACRTRGMLHVCPREPRGESICGTGRGAGYTATACGCQYRCAEPR
jgi:hypothetical protein